MLLPRADLGIIFPYIYWLESRNYPIWTTEISHFLYFYSDVYGAMEA